MRDSGLGGKSFGGINASVMARLSGAATPHAPGSDR
jgi:hypothetical protein